MASRVKRFAQPWSIGGCATAVTDSGVGDNLLTGSDTPILDSCVRDCQCPRRKLLAAASGSFGRKVPDSLPLGEITH